MVVADALQCQVHLGWLMSPQGSRSALGRGELGEHGAGSWPCGAGIPAPLHSMGSVCHVCLCLPTALLPSLVPLQQGQRSRSPGLCFQVVRGEANATLPWACGARGTGGHGGTGSLVTGAGDLEQVTWPACNCASWPVRRAAVFCRA